MGSPHSSNPDAVAAVAAAAATLLNPTKSMLQLAHTGQSHGTYM
jgi:hypothetical protein